MRRREKDNRTLEIDLNPTPRIASACNVVRKSLCLYVQREKYNEGAHKNTSQHCKATLEIHWNLPGMRVKNSFKSPRPLTESIG